VADPATGRWKRLVGGPVSVKWFGAKGDAVVDDTAAISAALAALPAWNVSPPGTPGGIIFFPPGTYLFSSQIALSAQTNVTFRGAGARYMQDFSASTSRLLYIGGGSTPAVYVSTNYARGWQVENMEISYNNANGTFTGSLIHIDLTAGISFKHCVLGGASSTTVSAEAVVKISGTERVKFQDCLIQFAQRCVWVPTGEQSDGAGNTALITIRDCQLDNITRVHVEF
jgi:polygalacturonase